MFATNAICQNPLLNVRHVYYSNISIECSPQTLFKQPLNEGSRKPLVKPHQLDI